MSDKERRLYIIEFLIVCINVVNTLIKYLWIKYLYIYVLIVSVRLCTLDCLTVCLVSQKPPVINNVSCEIIP